MIFTGDGQKPTGSPLGQTTDAGSAFGRVEPILTNKSFKERFLFGVPLWSALPDPVTRKRQEYTPEMISDAIVRAINDIELKGGFCIQPVIRQRRLPFDLNSYKSYGYLQVPDRPILSVESIEVKPSSNLGAVYRVPLAFIEMGNAHRGQLNFCPFMPASAFTNTPMSMVPTAGAGSAFLSILGGVGFMPAFWDIVYQVGFGEGKVPVVVNSLIGTVAAIDVLSALGATNRVDSYSVGIDAANQSVSTQGMNIYETRIKHLEEEKTALLAKLRKKFGFSLAAMGTI